MKITLSATTLELAPGELYAGILLDEHGQPTAHLIALPEAPEPMPWAEAMAYCQAQQAELPTQQEARLLLANQKAAHKEKWYWTRSQFSANYAWFQGFHNGGSDWGYKTNSLRVRPVRRLFL